MDFLDTIREKAKEKQKSIVLPEGDDERVCRAAEEVVKQKIARVILLGDPL